MSEIAFRIRIEDDEDLVAAREAAEMQGVALREIVAPPSGDLEMQVEAVTAVLIGTGVVVGIKMVMDWWDRRKGGLVIDLRPEAQDLFYRDKALSYGYIVTFPAGGGEVKVDVKDVPDSAHKWVSEVISGAFKSFADVAEAARKAVGVDRVKAIAPSR